jgi:LPS sulfotransferase NodH
MCELRSYLICATQRCGSTLLCEWLDQTGVLGHPNEYLGLWQEYADRDDAPFWELVVQETKDRWRGANGVFGCKVMANTFPVAMQWLRRVPAAAGLDDWRVGQLAFGPGPVVRVQRRDRVRQAISRYIAMQTGIYHVAADDAVGSELLGGALGSREADRRERIPFDFAAIDTQVALIGREERYWDELFAAAGVAPLELVYEDFVRDRAGTVRAVLEHVGIDPADANLAFEERMARMSDGVNERFYREYHAHKDAAG